VSVKLLLRGVIVQHAEMRWIDGQKRTLEPMDCASDLFFLTAILTVGLEDD